MPLAQQTLPFRERKGSISTSKPKEVQNGKSAYPQSHGSIKTRSCNSTGSPSKDSVQPVTPSKRRNKNQTEPPSPPKIKCEGRAIEPIATPPVTPSSKVAASPYSHAAPSPKTPSTYISNLSLESPTVQNKGKHLPPKALFLDPADLSKARTALHTHCHTDLPGREEELAKLKNFVDSHLKYGTSGSIYISGPPGTGKTACLSHIIKQPDIKNQCKIVNINCTAVESPNSIYSKLLDQLNLKKSAKSPLETITKYFQSKHKTVLIVFDEMDQLGTKSQSILYTVFEWPATLKGIIIIGIANALDLPDRMLPRLKAKLELAPQLLHFAPYSKDQLLAIFQYRLKEAADVFMPSALQFLAGKQAAVNGDVRRALDTARRLVENAGRNVPQDRNLKDPMSNPIVPVELDTVPNLKTNACAESHHKSLCSSPRKPMTPVHSHSQATGQSDLRSPIKSPLSPLHDSKSTLKENASPIRSKSARKLNFLEEKNATSNSDLKNIEPLLVTNLPKPIDIKMVMAAYNDVYGTSQTSGRSANGSKDELPIQHKLAVCSLLLILGKGKNKDVTLGMLHDVYKKVCLKRHITPLDQGEFLNMLNLIEASGMIQLKSRGKGGAGRLIRVYFQRMKDEVVSALQDWDLLASILSDVSCLS